MMLIAASGISGSRRAISWSMVPWTGRYAAKVTSVKRKGKSEKRK